MSQTSDDDWDVTEEEEYKRVPALKSADVDKIMEWSTKQPHLPKFPRHRAILFLRACDNSLERTKETIEKYFTMRTRYPDLLATMDYLNPSSQNAMTKLDLAVMPKKDAHGVFYIYIKNHQSTVSEWTPNDFTKLALMAFEISHLTMGSGNGYRFVADMKYITIPLMITTPIRTIQILLKFLQEASHYKIKSLEFINGGSVMDKLISMMKPFLSKEVTDVIHIYPTEAALVENLDAKFVPSDYGGTGPSMKDLHVKTCELLEKKNEWFKEDSKLMVDEKKRLETSKYFSNEMEGSFKKLDID